MTTTTSGPTYRVATYTVYPTGYDGVSDPSKERWCLTVVDAGDGWAIRRARMCLSFAGRWEFEPPPGARTADFLHRCRFNERAALFRARRYVDRLPVQGMVFAEFALQVQRDEAKKAEAQALKRLKKAVASRLDLGVSAMGGE